MRIVFFSSDMTLVDEWKLKYDVGTSVTFYEIDSLVKWTDAMEEFVVVSDYDSMASEINKLVASNTLPKNFIVLERTPEIVTGKFLISHKIQAYGNARMLKLHYKQMIDIVSQGKVWTYPELTAALTQREESEELKQDSLDLINHRLSEKEREVVFLILKGLTNDAIAHQLGITTRTVKAHITSLFSKLHVNDRLSLVLLLK